MDGGAYLLEENEFGLPDESSNPFFTLRMNMKAMKIYLNQSLILMVTDMLIPIWISRFSIESESFHFHSKFKLEILSSILSQVWIILSSELYQEPLQMAMVMRWKSLMCGF